MIQFMSEIAWYQLLLLRITRQTAAKCFKLQMAVAAAERFFGTFLITSDYLS